MMIRSAFITVMETHIQYLVACCGVHSMNQTEINEEKHKHTHKKYNWKCALIHGSDDRAVIIVVPNLKNNRLDRKIEKKRKKTHSPRKFLHIDAACVLSDVSIASQMCNNG